MTNRLAYLNQPQKYILDGCKLLWHQKELQKFLNGERIYPITIDIGIHKGCNILCKFCYGIFQKKGAAFIPAKRLLMLADDAQFCRIKGVAIIGDGEPTLNTGLYPFVQALKNYNIDCAVATNGLLLKEYQADILTKCCTWVRFNISAIDKYDYIMGAPKNSLKKFDKVIKYVTKHKKKCTIGLQMVLIPNGFSEIIPLAKAAVDWGVDYFVIKQFSDPEGSIPTKFDMDEYKNAFDDLKKAEFLSNNKTRIIVKWGAINDSTNITKYKRWDFDRCIDLPFLFQISGNGSCYPCGYLFGNADFCYGNVCNDSLFSILNSERYWNIIKKISKIPLEKLCRGQCRHCESLKFLDVLTRIYKGNLKESLIDMCGGTKNYSNLMKHPPEHLSFL